MKMKKESKRAYQYYENDYSRVYHKVDLKPEEFENRYLLSLAFLVSFV